MPEPEPQPTVAALRPAPGSEEDPVHRRSITIDVFQREGHLLVVGTLCDERPWAGDGFAPRRLHEMELAVVVRLADMVIVDAAADMRAFPHVECTNIEAKFHDLVGLSVARGYTNAVQERFGRERGCSHLEFLARALGPVVVQGLTSAGAWRMERGDGRHPMGEGAYAGFLANTCHIWVEDGPGPQKLAVGWRPGLTGYPAPPVAEVRRRLAESGTAAGTEAPSGSAPAESG